MKKLGSVLFLAAFSFFLSSLFFNDFILKPGISKKYLSETQIKDLGANLTQLENVNYSNSFSFVFDLSKVINAQNKVYDQQQSYDKKIYDDVLLSITKESAIGYFVDHKPLWLLLTFVLACIGGLLSFSSMYQELPGIKNNNIFFDSLTSRKALGILTGSFLILFYIFLYFYPAYLANWVIIVDPVSEVFGSNGASRWFMYGFLYTLSILVMGFRFIAKYRHVKYQRVRTFSIIFCQVCFAFILPEIMASLNLPSADLKNMWPLDYSFFFNYRLDKLIQGGGFGIFLLVWGITLFVLGVPIMVYFFGKRWYCSWVCGCGGLAETLGDPWRQLSDKSTKAWKIERYLIHGVLAFAIIMTIGVLYTYVTANYNLLGFIPTEWLKSWYGFFIGSIFSGVVGTGFYPLMGNRVWCRFGCPLAAYLGIMQRFKSKFRITTNGGQCISCGNCSTYCEMGIDVRAYAQKGQDIVRSSCVGCGICSAVCPRGVLNLENADANSRLTIAPKYLKGSTLQ